MRMGGMSESEKGGRKGGATEKEGEEGDKEKEDGGGEEAVGEDGESWEG